MSPPSYLSRSIRAFIGSKDYQQSRDFYCALGFQETVVGDKMCFFRVNDALGFYLQDYYVKKWIENSMIFLEVSDLDQCWADLQNRKLLQRFKQVRLSSIQELDWGRECFLHDPAGVLWHFGEFKN